MIEILCLKNEEYLKLKQKSVTVGQLQASSSEIQASLVEEDGEDEEQPSKKYFRVGKESYFLDSLESLYTHIILHICFLPKKLLF